jgi:hypothetical protein
MAGKLRCPPPRLHCRIQHSAARPTHTTTWTSLTCAFTGTTLARDHIRIPSLLSELSSAIDTLDATPSAPKTTSPLTSLARAFDALLHLADFLPWSQVKKTLEETFGDGLVDPTLLSGGSHGVRLVRSVLGKVEAQDKFDTREWETWINRIILGVDKQT